MLKKFLLAVALGVAVYGSGVYAQEKVKVIYPDGSVRYEDPTPAKKAEEKAVPAAVVAAAEPVPAPAPAAAGTSVPCPGCGGGGNNGECKQCKPGINKPIIEPIDSTVCDGPEECTDFDNTPVGDLEEVDGPDVNYYDECKEHKVKIEVPVLVKHKTEYLKTDILEYKTKCCKITICVPCKCCKKVKKECTLQERMVTVDIRRRRDNHLLYDVYVLGVQGMPKQWLLVNNGTAAEVKTATGVTP